MNNLPPLEQSPARPKSGSRGSRRRPKSSPRLDDPPFTPPRPGSRGAAAWATVDAEVFGEAANLEIAEDIAPTESSFLELHSRPGTAEQPLVLGPSLDANNAQPLAVLGPSDAQANPVAVPTRTSWRGIDAEGLVLNCTPAGLVDQLMGDEGGIDATDRWGWSCLHKAAIYGKADHVIALLDAGADPSLRTEHDPTQIYAAHATALELAEMVQREGWGDREPIANMLQVAESGRWTETRTEEERRKLKRQENIRLRQEQIERDLSMVAKGEALMRMKQRQEMEENVKAMRNAERRRDEAVERETKAEKKQVQAEEARDEARRQQAEAESAQRSLHLRLAASRTQAEGLNDKVAELEKALAGAVETSRALKEELDEQEKHWKARMDKAEKEHAAKIEAIDADLRAAKAAGEALEEQLANRVRQHRRERERAEAAESSLERTQAELQVAKDALPPVQQALAETKTALEEEKVVSAGLRTDLAKEQAAKADVLARLELLKAALEAEQGKIAQMKLDHQAEVTGLCDALEQSRDEVSACRETIAGLQESLEGAKRSLEEERQNLARALREFAADIERINQQHEASMAQLQAKLDHEVKEKETVAQQLVGKIRQLRIERERAEVAEGRIPPLVAEIESLKAVQDELRQSLADAEAALAGEKKKVEGLRSDLAHAQAEQEKLVGKLASETAARAAAEAKVAQLSQEIAAKRAELSSYQQRLVELEEQLATTKQTLEDERKLFKLKDEEWKSATEKLIAEHEARVAELEAQLEAAVEEKESVAQQLVGKIRQLRIERDRADEAEGKIPPLVTEIESLKAAQDELKQSLSAAEAALAAEKTKLEGLRSDLAREQAEKAELVRKLASETEAREAEAAKVAQLLVDLAAARALVPPLEQRLDELEAELVKTQRMLEHERTILPQKEAEWRAAMEQLIKEHQGRVSGLEVKLEHALEEKESVAQQLVGKIRQLRIERDRADEAEGRIPPLVTEIESLKAVQDELKQTLSGVEAALAAEQQKIEALRSDLAREQAEKADVVLKLESETAAREAEAAKVAQLSQEIAEKRAELSSYQQRLVELEEQLASATQTLDAERKQFKAKGEQWVAATERLVSEHQASLAEMEGKLEHEMKEKETVAQQLVAKIRLLRSERERLEEVERKIPPLLAEIEAQKAAQSRLREDMAGVEAALAAEKDTVEVLRFDLAYEQTEKTVLIGQVATEKEATKAAEAQIPPLQNELAESRAELEACLKKLAALEEEFSSTRQTLDEIFVVRGATRKFLAAHARNVMEQKESEWAALLKEVEVKLEHEVKEKETVAHQLVGKIRQVRTERERADEAESKLPPLVAEIESLKAARDELKQSLLDVQSVLAAEQEKIETLRSDLAREQAEKFDVVQKLALETAAREAEEAKVAQLRQEIAAKVAELSSYQQRLVELEEQLASAKQALEEERQALARKDAEWKAATEKLVAEHEASVSALEAKIAHAVKEKETVAQQLVSKIRQLRTERERADAAESELATTREKLEALTGRYKSATTELRHTQTELTGAKQRIAKLALAVDEERRTSEELRVSLVGAGEDLERAEQLGRELAEQLATVEAQLAAAKALVPPLEARIAELLSDIEKVKAEFAAYQAEAEALQARLEREKALLSSELEAAQSTLAQSHDLAQQLDESKERERISAQKLLILNSQFTRMVATFSAGDLMSTPAAASEA